MHDLWVKNQQTSSHLKKIRINFLSFVISRHVIRKSRLTVPIGFWVRHKNWRSCKCIRNLNSSVRYGLLCFLLLGKKKLLFVIVQSNIRYNKFGTLKNTIILFWIGSMNEVKKIENLSLTFMGNMPSSESQIGLNMRN